MEAGKRRAVTWGRWLLFPLILILIIISVYFFLTYIRGNMIRDQQEDLATIADLKAEQIKEWRQEREVDARRIRESPFFIREAQEYLAHPSPGDRERELLQWMESYRQNYDYRSLFLVNLDIEPVLSVPPGGETLGIDALALLQEAMEQEKIVLSDLIYEYTVEGIHINLIVPIPSQPGGGPAMGALLLRISPYDFLYPYIQSWPTPTETAETALVRRDGDEVVFLNELRHRSGTALNLRFPASDPKLPAAMAVNGVEGIVEGVDYRGEHVLAAIKPVPHSPWYVVAKEDTAEIYSPVMTRTWLMIGITAALLVALASLFGFLWFRRQSRFYREKYQAEVERRALEKHYEYLTRYANDIILLMDKDWNIVEANQHALDVYGYVRDEFMGMPAASLHSHQTRSDFSERAEEINRGGGVVFEAEHRRKDGTTFPVEISARRIDVEGKTFYQEIIRDITERKRLQESLESLNRCFLGLGTDPLDNMQKIALAGADILDGALITYSRLEKGLLHVFLTTEEGMGFVAAENPYDRLSYEAISGNWDQPTNIDDTAAYGYESFPPQVREGNYRSFTGLPVRTGERTVGFLGMYRKKSRAPSSSEKDILGMLARAMAVEEERLAYEDSLRDFLDIASHELRHPMTIIKGYAETLSTHVDTISNDLKVEFLQHITEGVKRLERLVHQLLETSHMERKELDINKRRSDPRDLLARAVRELGDRGFDRDIHTSIAAEVRQVSADPQWLLNAIIILLENAALYSPPDTPLEVKVEEKSGEVIISVLDRGSGVPEEERERIFERFYQLEDVRHHSSPGLGLWLYIARQIAEAHGGRIWHEPREGGGSIFRLCLPSTP